MATIELEIPDEVIDFIRNDKLIEPQTYFQNEVIKSLLQEYEKYYTKIKLVEAEIETATHVAKTKKDTVVKIKNTQK